MKRSTFWARDLVPVMSRDVFHLLHPPRRCPNCQPWGYAIDPVPGRVPGCDVAVFACACGWVLMEPMRQPPRA